MFFGGGASQFLVGWSYPRSFSPATMVSGQKLNTEAISPCRPQGLSRGRNGFRKDKGGEKLAETEEDLLRYCTDGTDAFDTLIYRMFKIPTDLHFHILCFRSFLTGNSLFIPKIC